MARFGTVVMNVADMRRAAEFWGKALDYVPRDGTAWDGSLVLVPRDGHGPSVVLDTQDRMHLDLHTDTEAEQRAEVERLEALGARRVPWTYPEDADFVVLSDTEGNVFCVVNMGAQ